MIVNLIAAILPLLPLNTVPTDTTTPTTAAAEQQVAPVMLYVWAHFRCDLPAAVAMARCNGFVPTSRPIFLSYVPEACGPAWVVYVRPQ